MVSKRMLLQAACSLDTMYCIASFCVFIAAARAAPWHSWYFWAALLLAYSYYYYLSSDVSITTVHGSSRNSFHVRAHRRMSTIAGRGYLPTPYILNANVATIYAVLGRPELNNELPLERETIVGLYSDGEVCVLDWSFSQTSKAARDTRTSLSEIACDEEKAHQKNPKAPVVVLFHGLTGGSSDSNVLYVTRYLNEAGFHVVIPVRRGCCEGTISSNSALPKHYEYGAVEDTQHAVNYISRKMSGHPLLAVGLSAGANILANYLGQTGRSSKIIGAVSVANGYCWDVGTRNLQLYHPVWDTVMSGMVHRTLFKRFHETILTAAGQMADGPRSPVTDASSSAASPAPATPKTPTTPLESFSSLKFLKRTGSMREYDEAISRRLHGYSSLAEFYRQQSCIHRLDNISVPTFFLNALDDPLVLPTGIPTEILRSNPKTLLVTTSSGGHLGWAEGWWPFRRVPSWMDRFILEALQVTLEESEALQQEQSCDDRLSGDLAREPPTVSKDDGSSIKNFKFD
jgi:predicted alpha/beta-fold hydrolase